MDIIQTVATETSISPQQVKQVVHLIEDGNTVPFIARYRKEATGNLDEVAIRLIRDRYDYITELEDRKSVILKSIEEQGKLTDELKKSITETTKKQILEDLYLPYKPKKRTRATIAKEMGLEPLAELMRSQQDYSQWLSDYISNSEEEVEETEIKQRARDIIAEWISEDAEIREKIRDNCWSNGIVRSDVQDEFKEQKTKFDMYYDYQEAIKQIPAHRYLAIRRGEEEGILKIRFEFPEESILQLMKQKWLQAETSGSNDLALALEDSFQRLLSPSIEVEIRVMLKTQADEDSIKVFSENLKNLLLAPLGGTKMIMGIDPGFKSGSKWVVVDETGKFHKKGVIYPIPPQNQVDQAKHDLQTVLKDYPCQYICIGNGTASREITTFIKQFLKEARLTQIQPVIVNESGASVYSASEIAREEFPELDVSFRGAISIARRFQDPLAELVKIDPKSIGVGQYQHDVNQKKLKYKLDEVVESCVNYVGVNLNTASVSLLSYVSGMNKTLAKNVVEFRNENGAFKTRSELTKVKRFGPKSFQQSAGFLKILGGNDPLDQSAVHPENYPVVLKMAEDGNLPISQLIKNDSFLDQVKIENYTTEDVGILTLKDIVDELKKPGRDPRDLYVGAALNDAVTKLDDLEVGMTLEGTVTNLTNFGAFIDIGVHQDGLVHLSEMADRFVKEPSEVCAVGDVVNVRVISVDIPRKRIGLSMKSKSSVSSKKGGKKTSTKAKQPQSKQSSGNMDVDITQLANKFKGL